MPLSGARNMFDYSPFVTRLTTKLPFAQNGKVGFPRNDVCSNDHSIILHNEPPKIDWFIQFSRLAWQIEIILTRVIGDNRPKLRVMQFITVPNWHV